MKKIISYALTAVLVAGFVLTPCSKAKADSTELMSYISFGADLRDNEKKTVMELLNVTEKDLEDYEVLSVTNEEEHKYLDEYLSKSVIGSRALSSVKVVKERTAKVSV